MPSAHPPDHPQHATPNGPQKDPARFAHSLAILQSLDLPPERIVTQLLQAGFPIPQVRAQFPHLPEGLFIAPTAPSSSRRLANAAARHTKPSAPRPRTPPPTPPSAVSLADQFLQRARQAPPTAPRAPTDANAATGTPSRNTAIFSALTTSATTDGIAFQYVPLIQCSFPHADPGTRTHYTRRNGWLELTLSTARPDTGLPYGVPARLLTIYCASEAVRTQSPEIYLGDSIQAFLRRLGVPITRGDRGSLRVYANQLLRLVHCALSIDENIHDSAGRKGLHLRQALFVEEARLWWDDQQRLGAGAGKGSSLILSPVLFESILERSAPLSTRAIAALRKSPMDLDLYAWLVHRLFHLSRPSSMTWTQLSEQFGHGYRDLRQFRRFFADSLQRVLVVYPEAKLKLADTGVMLLPSRPHIARDVRRVPS